MNYVRQTENLLGDDTFVEKRNALVARLRSLQLQTSGVDDYRPIQNELAQIVNEIRPIGAVFTSFIESTFLPDTYPDFSP